MFRSAMSINSFVHLNAAAAGFGEIFAVTADAGAGTGSITLGSHPAAPQPRWRALL